jgi:hypothetical protein
MTSTSIDITKAIPRSFRNDPAMTILGMGSSTGSTPIEQATYQAEDPAKYLKTERPLARAHPFLTRTLFGP